MAKLSGILSSLAGGILAAFVAGSKTKSPRRTSAPTHPAPSGGAVRAPADSAAGTASGRVEGLEAGRSGASATVELAAREVATLKLSYNPEADGTPDPGEIVWTWVPYEENDGRGKDRPVLVVGRLDADRVVAFALTSKPHRGERDYLALGTGEWDREGRPSWVDLGRILRVDDGGMRREASVLDRTRFVAVAEALAKRYGWTAA